MASDSGMVSRIDAVVDAALAEKRLVGGVVLVADEGETVYARAAGHADREAGAPVTDAEVDAMHARYYEALVALFAKHKDAAGFQNARLVLK